MLAVAGGSVAHLRRLRCRPSVVPDPIEGGNGEHWGVNRNLHGSWVLTTGSARGLPSASEAPAHRRGAPPPRAAEIPAPPCAHHDGSRAAAPARAHAARPIGAALGGPRASALCTLLLGHSGGVPWHCGVQLVNAMCVHVGYGNPQKCEHKFGSDSIASL